MSGKTREEICAHLRVCEEALLDPEVRRNRARVAALLAEGFLEFGSSGRVWSREEILELLAHETYQPPAMEDFRCDCLAEGVALVTYKTVRVDPESGPRAVVLRSSVWMKESGECWCGFTRGRKFPKPRLWGAYISWRRKRSSLSRLGQLEHPRQQTRRTATPTVTRTARMLPFVVSQWIRWCISRIPT